LRLHILVVDFHPLSAPRKGILPDIETNGAVGAENKQEMAEWTTNILDRERLIWRQRQFLFWAAAWAAL
jgi:hypothetical protein